MKASTIFAVLIFTAQLSFAQAWQHFFGGVEDEISTSVIQTSDGGFVMAGYTLSYGNGKKDAYVVKTDVNGKMQWQQVIGGAEDDEAYDIVQHSNGDFYIAGETESFGNGEADVWLIKLGADGTLFWTKTYGGPDEDYAAGLVLSAGGEPVLAGETESFGAGGGDVYLLKTDTSGLLLWSKTFGKTGDDEAYSISKVHDGGFILTGQTTSYSTWYGYAVRTNANGDSLWTKAFSIGSKGEKTFFDATELVGDSTFAFVGQGGTGNDPSMVIVKTNLAGDISYSNINYFSSYDYSSATSVIPDADGGFTIYGYHVPYYSYNHIVKFDVSCLTWTQKTFYLLYINYSGFYGNNQFFRMTDGSFVFGGSYYIQGSYGNTNYDFSILKTDSLNAFPVSSYHPPITAHGPTSWCDTTNSVLLTVPSGYRTYDWNVYPPDMDSAYVATQSGSYKCTVTDEDGIYTSLSMYVSVTPIPTATITLPGPINFCTASWDTVLRATTIAGCTYQWFFNGSPIAGATLTSYHPQASGSYCVSLSNSCGADTSAPVIVNANAPPTVSLYPLNGSIEIVQGIPCYTQQLSANSQPGVTYQWYQNGLPFQNPSNKYCPWQAGDYLVTVNNGCGSATSDTSVITSYYSSLGIIPQGPTNGCGVDSVQLALDWGISGGIQWYFNGVPIPNANTDSLWATQTGNYSVDFNFSCYSCGSTNYNFGGDQVSVVINHNPLPSISASGPVTMCSGTVDLVASPSGGTYSWYKNYVQIAGATSQTYTVTSAGSYRCHITTPSCGFTSSNTIDVYYGLPAATFSMSPSAICTGGSSTMYFSSPPVDCSYQWLLNGIPIVGATNKNYVGTVGGDYSCILTNGCGSDTTTVLTLTEKPIPSGTITPSGSSRICNGDSLLLTVASGNYTYMWYKSYSQISGATTSQYYAKASGWYYVYISNGTCGITTSADTLTVGPDPVNNIWESTSLKFCGNDSVQLNANGGTGYTYQWMLNGSPISAATDAIYFAGASGSYAVQIFDDIGCTDTSSAVTVNDSWVAGLSILAAGSTNFCPGSSVNFYSNTVATTYQWSFNGSIIPGATNSFVVADTSGLYSLEISTNQGCNGIASSTANEMNPPFLSSSAYPATCIGNDGSINLYVSTINDPVTYLWSNGSTAEDLTGIIPGIYSVTVTDYYGCFSSLTDTVDISLSLPPATITTYDTLICPGQYQTLYANTGIGLTYQWQYNGTNITAATNSSYSADTSGSFICIVSNSCGPTISNIITLYDDSLPSPVIIAGDSVLCVGDTIILNADTGPGFTYTWRRNGSNISGATNSSYNAYLSGTYNVIIYNSCGSISSNAFVIYNGAAVTATIYTNDPLTFCQGDNAMLNANAGNGLTYQWQLDGIDIAGETNATISATLGGTYTCFESNGCFTDTSNTIQITVLPLPTIQIATNDSVFCQGDSATLYVSASSVSTWQWKLNGTNITGANDSVYVANAGGTYSCTISDNCGITLSNTITVVEDIVPPPPVTGNAFTRICPGDSVTFSTTIMNGYSYQWFRYQLPVAGATTSSYAVTTTGRYRVQVTDSFGCQNFSSMRLVLVGCTVFPPPPPPSGRSAHEETGFETLVYPNPSQSSFTIELIGDERNFTLNVYDIMGQVVDHYADIPSEENFKFGGQLTPGIYQVEIIQGIKRKVVRVVKE